MTPPSETEDRPYGKRLLAPLAAFFAAGCLWSLPAVALMHALLVGPSEGLVQFLQRWGAAGLAAALVGSLLLARLARPRLGEAGLCLAAVASGMFTTIVVVSAAGQAYERYSPSAVAARRADEVCTNETTRSVRVLSVRADPTADARAVDVVADVEVTGAPVAVFPPTMFTDEKQQLVGADLLSETRLSVGISRVAIRIDADPAVARRLEGVSVPVRRAGCEAAGLLTLMPRLELPLR